jgi:hypothetical protein
MDIIEISIFNYKEQKVTYYLDCRRVLYINSEDDLVSILKMSYFDLFRLITVITQHYELLVDWVVS